MGAIILKIALFLGVAFLIWFAIVLVWFFILIVGLAIYILRNHETKGKVFMDRWLVLGEFIMLDWLLKK